jgi:hypothetical protein
MLYVNRNVVKKCRNTWITRIFYVYIRHVYVRGERGAAVGETLRFPMLPPAFVIATVVLGSTQPLTEYREYFLGGEAGRGVGMTTLPFHVPVVCKSDGMNALEPLGRKQG